MNKFTDGLKSFFSGLTNQRNALNQNYIQSERMSEAEMRAIYQTGIGSKIIRIKSSNALDDTIKFSSKAQRDQYNLYLKKHVDLASKYMLGFGRGLIVLFESKNADLSKTIDKNRLNTETARIKVFSGDMVYVNDYNTDLSSPDYYKPRSYQVRGITIHASRCVAFNYYMPTEIDLPLFQFGGISEFQMIRPQLISDGIVERSSATIVEKNATMFYKVKGFKELLARGKEGQVLDYFRAVENARSIYGAGVIDDEDNIEMINQTLSNLKDADEISLRRIAMVTGIPVSELVGESVRGLNSTGDNEKTTLQDTIYNLQNDFLLHPINELMMKFGLGTIEFKDNQGETANSRADYETKIIDNAVKLATIGEDYESYLNEKGITMKDDLVGKFFSEIE